MDGKHLLCTYQQLICYRWCTDVVHVRHDFHTCAFISQDHTPHSTPTVSRHQLHSLNSSTPPQKPFASVSTQTKTDSQNTKKILHKLVTRFINTRSSKLCNIYKTRNPQSLDCFKRHGLLQHSVVSASTQNRKWDSFSMEDGFTPEHWYSERFTPNITSHYLPLLLLLLLQHPRLPVQIV